MICGSLNLYAGIEGQNNVPVIIINGFRSPFSYKYFGQFFGTGQESQSCTTCCIFPKSFQIFTMLRNETLKSKGGHCHKNVKMLFSVKFHLSLSLYVTR